MGPPSAAASERRRLSAPTWRMEIRDPGMQRSTSLPAAASGAERCTLGRVVSGDGSPAADSRLAPCCILGGAPQPWQPASLLLWGRKAGKLPLRGCGGSWHLPAGRASTVHARGQTLKLGCSAGPKVWTTQRSLRRGRTVRARWEPAHRSLQSTSAASLSCQGKPLPTLLRMDFSLFKTWFKRQHRSS